MSANMLILTGVCQHRCLAHGKERDITTADWLACTLTMSANMLMLAVKRGLRLPQFLAMRMV